MLNRRFAIAVGLGLALLLPLGSALAAGPVAPGPPFPEPTIDRAVYDYAGVFRPSTITTLETTIDAIEARTGAEVVVYTQVWPYKIDEGTSDSNAAALIDQWGIGRRGFDDGLVILFDLDPSLVHGQVRLFAGAGFRSTFLADEERQKIFDEDMLPLLAAGDLNGAVLAAMQRVDAAATPEHANRLEFARQLNAVVGIFGGALALLGLAGWAVFHWLRYGRDPVYLDSDSILVPAPPSGMTAAIGTLVMDGNTSRRSLTTALMDLASRGSVAFREEHGFLGLGRTKLNIDVGARAEQEAMADLASASAATEPILANTLRPRTTSAGDRAGSADSGDREAIARARLALASRRPLGSAEQYLLTRLHSLASDGTIEPDEVPKLATDVPKFQQQLEDNAVAAGWFGRRPSSVVGRWRTIGFLELGAGVVAIWAGLSLPASGLTLVGGAAIAAGLITQLLAGVMPARTMAGAMSRAWLFAYKRTLARTMDQARSMDQVVKESGLSWLETPDEAVVWAVALGLSDKVEDVLGRTMSDSEANGRQVGYLPTWYQSHSGTSMSTGAVRGGGGSGGLFSSSGIPNIGGMFAALGTIGSAPSSGGSGGGGGFGGGGSGGGGGAGGGF
ncbi:MAG: TPM domain-containing protein [Chloroflexota bacterium]